MDAALRIGVVVLVLVFVVLAASVAAVVFEPDPAGEPLVAGQSSGRVLRLGGGRRK